MLEADTAEGIIVSRAPAVPGVDYSRLHVTLDVVLAASALRVRIEAPATKSEGTTEAPCLLVDDVLLERTDR